MTKKIKYDYVSVNSEYLLLSNNEREEQKINLSDQQLLRLSKEIINSLWIRNNAV
jgi:hypothetical protein